MENFYRDLGSAINYGRVKIENPRPADFHLHNYFEIYFFISGNVNYFIEKKVYPLRYGNLLVMNSHEIHKPSFFPGEPYERIVIHFDAAIAEALSSPSFNLLNCFVGRPNGEQNLMCLNRKQCTEILKLFNQIEAIGNETANGADILKLTSFVELLVFINRVFSSTLPREEESPSVPERLVPVLDHIDSHLNGDLSLDSLEHRFYINRFHLCRLFKEVTGSTLHEYILYKRVSRAKKLLSDGSSVTEACTSSGFNDYSNFLRIFRKTVGVSPGQYRKGMR